MAFVMLELDCIYYYLKVMKLLTFGAALQQSESTGIVIFIG